MKLSVKLDSRELNVFLNNVTQKGINKAVAKSLNRVSTTVKKEVSQNIKKSLGSRVAIGAIKKALPNLITASPKQDIGDQQEVIGAETKGFSLSLFRPKQWALGVSFNVNGKTFFDKHSFIAKMPGSSKRSVFRRESIRRSVSTRRGPAPNRSELPIEKRVYKSVYKQLPEFEKIIQKIVKDRFAIEFKSNFEHYVINK